jgi:hypothetical protein
MKLFEFDNPLLVDLIAVVSKLQSDIKNNKESVKGDWTPDRFLSFLKDNGVDQIDKSDLFDIINNKIIVFCYILKRFSIINRPTRKQCNN